MLFPGFAFFVTALLYASAGFGGGSTYNAILVLADTDYRIIPFVSLSCNIIVVLGGIWHFHRRRHLRTSLIFPWIIFSVPAAFLGGLVPVPQIYFTGLLGLTLFLSAVKLLWPERAAHEEDHSPHPHTTKYLPAALGTGLGLLAGVTGIGGGIFLAPLLHFLKWGNAKQIAAECALFIFVNSLSGLTGQLLKLHNTEVLSTTFPYLILLPIVFAGGQIGSWLGAGPINMAAVKKITALLILYVAIRLLMKFAEML